MCIQIEQGWQGSKINNYPQVKKKFKTDNNAIFISFDVKVFEIMKRSIK